MDTGTPPLRVAIAEEIRAYMGRRRMSAVQLAKRTGKSQSYMSRRLTGELSFDLDDLEAIGRALDVPMPKLLATTRWMSTDSLPVAA